ncbi:UNVERIFIED_CONTAM: hypothetical protein GTU68_012643 [Idotea baltica]|nr:hypothetical protein [Idotea baltica]
MHLSRFTQTSMTYMMYQYGRKKTNLHQTYSLYHKFFKRNFQISPVHLVRRVHADSANSNVENPNQEKISTKRLLDEAVTFDGDEGTHPDDVWHSDPYEKVRYHKREQGKHFVSPPNIHPKETSILLFPGQGTQFVGMGKDLLEYPNVKEMFEGASQILEYDLLKLCLEGPDRDLEETKYQQPAILVASLAAVERLRHEQPLVLESCVATAGFSIGEITALTFAGAISFENAVRLVKVRGEAMQIASELTRSGMITVLFSPDSKLKFACSVAKEYCVKSGVQEVDCRVASYLYPHCKVVAGNEEALQFIIDNKDDFKLKRIRRLNVSGAFHTDLMRPAAFVFKEALQNAHVSRPLIPVYSNVDGRPYKSADHIRKQLPKQMYSPVRWEQTLHTLYERSSDKEFPNTFECGPGSSLKTILKMVNAKAWQKCSSC